MMPSEPMMPSATSNTKYRCTHCGSIYDLSGESRLRPPACTHCGHSRYEQLVVQQVCDFCSTPAEDVWWSYPCADFDYPYIPGFPTEGSQGGWLACPDCHALIATDDRKGLAQRSVDSDLERHPDQAEHRPFLMSITRRMHNAFFDNREGQPTREGRAS